MSDGNPRQRLLDAALEYVAENGITDLSLRELATALGTSHRMLIHHFGSKEALWTQIVRTVEQRQREHMRAMQQDGFESLEETMRSWWKHISDPALWANERLFFELYAQALQGHAHGAALLDGIVEDWVKPVAELNRTNGMAPASARAHARLGVALTRGLILDLLATGDVEEVDAAFAAYIDLYASWVQRAPEATDR